MSITNRSIPANGAQALKNKLSRLGTKKHRTPLHVDLLNELAWELATSNTEESQRLSAEALEYSTRLAYKKGIAFATRNMAYVHLISSDLEEALKTAMDVLEQFVELGEKTGEASAFDILGLAYWRLGSYDRALKYSYKALEVNQQIRDRRGEAWALHNIAAIFLELGDDGTTIENYEKALAIFREIEYVPGKTQVYSGLGVVYERSGEYDKALRYYHKSLDISKQINLPFGIARSLTDIGNIYFNKGDYERAYKYHCEGLALSGRHTNKELRAITLLNLSRVHLARREEDKALEAQQRALEIIKQTKAKPTACQIYKAIADLCEQHGDYRQALEHHKIFHRLREEVFSEESRIKLKNYQIRSEIEKAEKEAEIHRLKYVELAKMQAQLIQSGKMALLGNLVAGLAHEVNTPIGVINSNSDVSRRAIERLQKVLEGNGFSKNPALLRSLDILQKNNVSSRDAGNKIAGLIKSLRSFAQLDQSAVKMTDIREGLQDTLRLVQANLPPSIEIEKNLKRIPKIKAYPQELNQVFMTLLLNASEAISGEGKITVSTRSRNKTVFVTIKDTGRGIDKEELEQLFEIGFSRKDTTVRMRVGLANSYNIIQKHKGKIEVKSRVGKGTEFRIELPAE
jgi:signal transduction histidine kinase